MKKNVLLTGANGSIGVFLKKELSKKHNIISIVRHKNKINNYQKKTFYCDLSKFNEVNSTMYKIKKKFKKINLLILTTGLSKKINFKKNSWQKNLDSNLLSVVNIIECFQKLFFTKSNIIVFSSIAGISNIGAPIEYSVSKSALNFYCRLKAKELAKKNIRLNVISPGNIYQKNNLWGKKLKANKPKTLKYIKKVSPLNKFCNPKSILSYIKFLDDKHSDYITGSNLILDSGQTL